MHLATLGRDYFSGESPRLLREHFCLFHLCQTTMAIPFGLTGFAHSRECEEGEAIINENKLRCWNTTYMHLRENTQAQVFLLRPFKVKTSFSETVQIHPAPSHESIYQCADRTCGSWYEWWRPYGNAECDAYNTHICRWWYTKQPIRCHEQVSLLIVSKWNSQSACI